MRAAALILCVLLGCKANAAEMPHVAAPEGQPTCEDSQRVLDAVAVERGALSKRIAKAPQGEIDALAAQWLGLDALEKTVRAWRGRMACEA